MRKSMNLTRHSQCICMTSCAANPHNQNNLTPVLAAALASTESLRLVAEDVLTRTWVLWEWDQLDLLQMS